MELTSLIKGQQELFEQLRKAERNLRKANQEMRSKYSYLTARMEALDKLGDAFSQNHLEIVANASTEQTLQLPYFKDDMQDNFQEFYIQYKALLKEYITLANPTTMTTKTASSTSTVTNVNSLEVKLPRIELPKFSGKYTEWQSFFDMFVSLIHENTTLAPVQKLHYLKSNLSGEPEMLLRNFPTTAANYIEAWEQLTKRYNNKRYNCNSIMKTLFGQKPIQNESASAIRLLLDTTTSCLKALNNLSIKTDQWDAILIHLVVSKLDHESHRQWEQEVSKTSDELPTWSQLETFLETRFRSLEMIDTKQTSSTKPTQKKNIQQEVKTKAFHSAMEEKVSTTEPTCAMCDGSHFIYYCAEFKKLPVIERQKIAETKKLCFNCMAPTHPVVRCHQRTSCRRCRRKHHTVLHFDKEDKQAFNTSRLNDKQAEQPTNDETTVVANFSRGDLRTYHVLLPTAIVKTTPTTDSHALRALIDQGSQASFVSEDTVQVLGLKRTNVNEKVSSLGDGQLSIKHAVSIKVESRYEPGKNMTVNAYVIKSLTSLLPSHEVHIPDWQELKNLPLADPGFASPGKVDLLLGADVYGEILQKGFKKSPYGNLIAQNTIFGWIVSGKMSKDLHSETITSLHIQIKEDKLRRNWEIDNEINTTERKTTREEKHKKNTIREDGNPIMSLPFKTTELQCQDGKSCDIDTRKVYALEKNLRINTALADEHTTLENYELWKSGPDFQYKREISLKKIIHKEERVKIPTRRVESTLAALH
ncbi:uncharacterized protein LOC123865799 [Maniola jurtina]|uniref:uncharacterized protein LOC123865799 n=1 Tax=Maniola jurtina TaxID=191418 RepID=UPI001E68DC41|nr:uncharacterized protein LOC123865799 [Maniola jurtina]